MKPQNLTALNLLSKQVSHISMEEEIPNLGNLSVKEAKGAQLTIFYGGEVIVFDNVGAEKAKEIMSIASRRRNNNNNFQNHNNNSKNYAYNAFSNQNKSSLFPSPTTPQFPFLIPNTANNSLEEHNPQPQSRSVVCDLPLARKASLHRFLEKRKYRIAARAPYQTSSPMLWLAMVPTSPQENSESSSSVV